jgi:hypothetical protein
MLFFSIENGYFNLNLKVSCYFGGFQDNDMEMSLGSDPG